MKDQATADRAARALFPKGVVAVQRYTEPEWHDGGWRGWRIVMGDRERTIHWMTTKGRHEEEVCCKPQRKLSMREAMTRPEVVRR